MRSETKLKVARRKHTIVVLRWLYSRRGASLHGARLSLDHRHRQRGGVADSRPLTYGEVDVPDFLSILDLAKPREGEVFVDLGSGTGKAVLAAACGFPEFSKCRGIELVQGLANAASDHLQTVKIFLAKPHPDTPNAIHPTIRTDSAAEIADTPPAQRSQGVVDGTLRLGGRGGGKRGSSEKAAANQGLTALELEALVADLLSLRPCESQPSGVLDGERGGNATAASSSMRQATAGEVASLLVHELGHRRYKASLRGYGGLQKFLAARRASEDASGRLIIAEGGGTVESSTPSEITSSSTRDLMQPGRTAGEGSGEGSVKAKRCSSVSAGQGSEGVPPDFRAIEGCAAATPPVVVNLKAIRDGVRGPLEACPIHSPPTCPLPAADSTSTTAATLTPSSSTSCDSFNPKTGLEAIPAPPVTVGAEQPGGSGGRKGGHVEGIDKRRLPEDGPLSCDSLSGVELVCGDIFEESWAEAGVVYVASLLFDDGMMARLGNSVRRLQKGARIISLRPIPAREPSGAGASGAGASDSEVVDGGEGALRADGTRGEKDRGSRELRLVHEGVFRMSWQMARVYIYVRL